MKTESKAKSIVIEKHGPNIADWTKVPAGTPVAIQDDDCLWWAYVSKGDGQIIAVGSGPYTEQSAALAAASQGVSQ